MHPILRNEAACELTVQPTEHRHALRQMARKVPITIEHETEGRFNATLQDLSRRGMRIRSSTNIRCGEVISIVPAENDSDVQRVECRIQRVQRLGTDSDPVYEYGVELCMAFRDRGHRWFLHYCYGGKRDTSVPVV